MFVTRTARHSWRKGLVKEGHWKITKVEQTRFNSIALLEMLQNPSRWLLGKPALTCAADDYRDRCHVLILFCFCSLVLSIRLLILGLVRCLSNPPNLDHVEIAVWSVSASVPAANRPNFFKRPCSSRFSLWFNTAVANSSSAAWRPKAFSTTRLPSGVNFSSFAR